MELNPGLVFNGLQFFTQGRVINTDGDILIIFFDMDWGGDRRGGK